MKDSHKPRFGYCAVTADFLHIGHINFIKECKSRCETLIVGIMSDDCVKEYKGEKPVMRGHERAEIVKSLRFVDKVWEQRTYEFPHHVLRLKEAHGEDFIIFDTHEHNRKNSDVLLYKTLGISSTLLKKTYL